MSTNEGMGDNSEEAAAKRYEYQLLDLTETMSDGKLQGNSEAEKEARELCLQAKALINILKQKKPEDLETKEDIQRMIDELEVIISKLDASIAITNDERVRVLRQGLLLHQTKFKQAILPDTDS